MKTTWNVFDGILGFFTFVFMIIGFTFHDISMHKESEKQYQNIEQLSNKIDSLRCSIDSLENILYD